MKIGSLFSGIGGLELGLERAGVGEVVWQVERDPYAAAVLKKHWPNARRHDDVTTFPPEGDWSADVICGGFPCQDLSYAGKGAGIDGERSGLWREFARIVRALRPRFVVVENVPALIARGLGRVLGDLAVCGYDAEWDCVPASSVGAPHHRDRLFIIGVVAHAARLLGDVRAHNAECDRPVGRSFSESRNGCGAQDLGDAYRASENEHAAKSGSWRTARKPSRWSPEPDVGRVAHGVPSRVDRLRCLGNAVVPQVAEVVGRRLMEIARSEAAR